MFCFFPYVVIFFWGMTDKLFLHVYCVLVKCVKGNLSFPSFMIFIFWTCLNLSFMACSFSHVMWFCVFGELAWFCFMVISILTFGICFSLFTVYSCLFSYTSPIKLLERKVFFFTLHWLIHLFVFCSAGFSFQTALGIFSF